MHTLWRWNNANLGAGIDEETQIIESVMDIKEATKGDWAGHSRRHYWLALEFDEDSRLTKERGGIHRRALGPNFWWYQHHRRLREVERDRGLLPLGVTVRTSRRDALLYKRVRTSSW